MTQQHKEVFSRPLLRAFLRGVPIFPSGSWVRLSSGDLAQVAQAVARFPLMPAVTVRYDRQGQPYPDPQTVDLAREAQLSIVEAISDPTPLRRQAID